MLTLTTMVLAAALSGAGVDKGTPWKKPALIYGGAALGDLLSTEIALRRPQTWEAHPLMGERPIRFAIKGAATFGMVKLDQWAQRKDRRISWAMRGVWLVGNGWLVVHNLREGKGRK